MWVLDTGRIGSDQKCSPQILIFNLRNDELVHRYRFPDGQFKPAVSIFITPVSSNIENSVNFVGEQMVNGYFWIFFQVLDIQDPPPGRCLNTVAYIADVTGFGVLVYNFQLNRSWRTQNKLYYPIPEYGTHTVAGESFDLMDGVFGLALTPRKNRRNEEMKIDNKLFDQVL